MIALRRSLTNPRLRFTSYMRPACILSRPTAIRVMSSKVQQPEILSREELKTDAKFLKLERIKWKDQDGKEVYTRFLLIARETDGTKRMWEAANRATRSKAGVDCSFLAPRCPHADSRSKAVHILALLHHPSKPVSTIIIEQYRPPIGSAVIGRISHE